MIIRLAEKNIRINNIYPYIEKYCHDYLIDENSDVDFSIQISLSDIEFERKKSAVTDKKEGNPIRNFSDEYLETLAVYRKIADKLLEYDTLLFHGSVIAVDGKGYIFTAKSGTGKSTHTRLWREYFSERAVMINDDKPLLKINEKSVTAYGTAWDGKHRLSTNTSAVIYGLCVLERDTVNHIEKADKNQIYPIIVQQTNRSLIPQNIMPTLKLIDRLIKNVPIYRLGCNMEQEAVRVAFNGMQI